MISIRQFLDRRTAAPAVVEDLLEAVSQLRSLLQSGVAIRTHVALPESRNFDQAWAELLGRLDSVTAALELVHIAIEALEASEKYTLVATEQLREQSRHMQSMVVMLTATLADISGQSQGSVTRLQTIEREIERASGLDDIRALRASLAGCLAAVKEAAFQEKKATQATMERLSDHIKSAPEPIVVDDPSRGAGTSDTHVEDAEYVAIFKLQRAAYVSSQFGEGARDQMLSLIGEGLKAVQGPGDRLMRWKGTSLVMFLLSAKDIAGVQRRLSTAVRKISRCRIETGKNSAPLAVGVEWVVFPQARYPSLDVVFAEVDAFLARESA